MVEKGAQLTRSSTLAISKSSALTSLCLGAQYAWLLIKDVTVCERTSTLLAVQMIAPVDLDFDFLRERLIKFSCGLAGGQGLVSFSRSRKTHGTTPPVN